MKRFIVLAVLFLLSGCAYNSRNLVEVTGENMKFSYGLIACENVKRVMLLRETNAGKGEVANNLQKYFVCEEEPIIEVKNETENKSIYPRDK